MGVLINSVNLKYWVSKDIKGAKEEANTVKHVLNPVSFKLSKF